jgi:hypothetical protein
MPTSTAFGGCGRTCPLAACMRYREGLPSSHHSITLPSRLHYRWAPSVQLSLFATSWIFGASLIVTPMFRVHTQNSEDGFHTTVGFRPNDRLACRSDFLLLPWGSWGFHPSEFLVFYGRSRMTRKGFHGVEVYQEITVASRQSFALEFRIPPGVPLLRFLMIRVLTWIAFGFSVYCGKCDTLNIIL